MSCSKGSGRASGTAGSGGAESAAAGSADGTGAGDAIAFQNAITRISDDIVAKVGSSAAVAVSNPLVTATDNADFVSKYNSGTWTGDLNSFAIDVATGVETTTSLWTSGSAATQLDLRTPASRFIATSTDVPGTVGGIQFQPTAATTPTKLSAAQEALLGTPPALTDGAAVLAYLRGDRSGESASYRVRAHLLGDIVSSTPLLLGGVAAQDFGYSSLSTGGSATDITDDVHPEVAARCIAAVSSGCGRA